MGCDMHARLSFFLKKKFTQGTANVRVMEMSNGFRNCYIYSPSYRNLFSLRLLKSGIRHVITTLFGQHYFPKHVDTPKTIFGENNNESGSSFRLPVEHLVC